MTRAHDTHENRGRTSFPREPLKAKDVMPR